MVRIKVTMRKDGQQVASFRGAKGRVRTSAGPIHWVTARQLTELALYGIKLQREQAAAGLGSDGQPMPPLKSGPRRFVRRVGGQAQFAKKIRNLYGPGIGGHMLDSIRINYVDDQRAQFGITTLLARQKARANERRYPWYGWSSASMQKLRAKAAEIFNLSVADQLFTLGLIGSTALSRVGSRLRRVA